MKFTKTFLLFVLVLAVSSNVAFSKSDSNEIVIDERTLTLNYSKTDLITNVMSDINKAHEVVILDTAHIKTNRRKKLARAFVQFKYKGVMVAKWEPYNGYCFADCIENYVVKYNKLLEWKSETEVAIVTDINDELLRLIFITTDD